MRRAAFVGRQEEIAQARDALTAARQGAGSVLLLAGEAGIGKTSLAQEVTRAAAWLGTPAVWGPAIEGEGTPPYWVWRQAMGALGRLAGSGGLLDWAHLEAGPSPFVLFEEVAAVLHRVAEPDGLVVVLDDLHWADSGSLRLLQVAAAQVPASRVLILGTYREPERDQDVSLAHVLPSLLRERGVSRLRLRGLGANETESLLSQTLDQPVPAALVRQLLAQTDGNPFYLLEVADSMRKAGRGRLPGSLQEIARRRLALVGDECRRTLESAAVIGRGFDLDLLVAAVGNGEPSALVDQLAEAGGAGLVEDLGPGRYQFAHALLREALYLDLSPRERAAAHGRVAAAIGGMAPAARRARIDALAHHLRNTLPLGNASAALAATMEAAEADEAELAFEQAADGYAEAVALTDKTSASSHPRSELLLRQARCLQRAGAAAWPVSQMAAEAARAENDPRALAGAALVERGLVDRNIAEPLLDLCREALGALAGADPILEARLLAQMSLAAGSIGGRAAEPGLADRALETARRVGDPEAQFLALQAKENEITGRPELAQVRLELSQEAVRVAESSPDPALAVWAHSWRLGASWELGLRGQADSELAALEVAVERIKEPLARWRLEVARGSLALIDGRYRDALAASERALAIARPGGNDAAALLARVLRHLAAERTGDTSAEKELRDELAVGGARLWYASYLAEQGRVAEVRRIFPNSPEALPPPGTDMWLIATAGMAVVAAALEDRGLALKLYEQLAPYPELHVVRGPQGGYEGPVAYYCGLLATVLGRLEDAERWYGRALLQAGQIGSPPFEALARYELARLLARRGRPRDRATAISLLEQAQSIADRLGMRPLAAWTAAELEALRHPRGRPTMLSDRELEVSGLVAEGLTNRAIGERLHISERTAENHVKNILDKLGLDSRAQIAAWSAGQREKLST